MRRSGSRLLEWQTLPGCPLFERVPVMSELILTDVDDVVLHELRERATLHGRTPIEEAKAILATALRGSRGRLGAGRRGLPALGGFGPDLQR